jgi:hypothetical protein
MKEVMRYITVEEHELYEKLADQYKIKGYSPPASLMCCSPNSEFRKFAKLRAGQKVIKERNR